MTVREVDLRITTLDTIYVERREFVRGKVFFFFYFFRYTEQTPRREASPRAPLRSVPTLFDSGNAGASRR